MVIGVQAKGEGMDKGMKEGRVRGTKGKKKRSWREVKEKNLNGW